MRPRRSLAVLMAFLVAGLLLGPVASQAQAAAPRSGSLHADLDGRPIALADVGRHFCEDFAYPAIHCFSTEAAQEAAVSGALSASSLNYVVVYEFTNFAGASMYFSQSYSSLVTIGWNDRISSLRGLNSQSSTFFVDWFYSGDYYLVCCNGQYTGLGAYDNTFSSVSQP